MKILDKKCNIIPIIAKADMISKNGLLELRKKIMNETEKPLQDENN